MACTSRLFLVQNGEHVVSVPASDGPGPTEAGDAGTGEPAVTRPADDTDVNVAGCTTAGQRGKLDGNGTDLSPTAERPQNHSPVE